MALRSLLIVVKQQKSIRNWKLISFGQHRPNNRRELFAYSTHFSVLKTRWGKWTQHRQLCEHKTTETFYQKKPFKCKLIRETWKVKHCALRMLLMSIWIYEFSESCSIKTLTNSPPSACFLFSPFWTFPTMQFHLCADLHMSLSSAKSWTCDSSRLYRLWLTDVIFTIWPLWVV